MEMEELRERIRKAFATFGFFIFEEDLLDDVKELLKMTHLDNTLKVVRLGRTKFDTIPGAENVDYYAVILNIRDCLKSEEIEKCVTEKRKSVIDALSEIELKRRPKGKDSLRAVYEMLSKE